MANKSWQADLKDRDVTDPQLYLNRRRFIKGSAASVAALTLGASPTWASPSPTGKPLQHDKNAAFAPDEALTPYQDVSDYCNFYELGTGKGDPAKHAHWLRSDPWSVTIEGEVAKPGTLSLEALLKPHPLEERIYRLRCVEAWSMVVPWLGFPLADLLKRFEPTSRAKYVAFETLYDPTTLKGQKHDIIHWPYAEGLRMDEAMNPLSLMAVGLYGHALPNQNGAPLRLVVPWKYGFKSIKSIVTIRLTEEQPPTAWNRHAPQEYGFYANVNPDVDHPRWSQAKERRIGEFFKRKTLPFNGYGDYVAGLYQGMDLSVHF
ncbi:oxidoreductase, molybdopterin binding protein [Magnetococcus marinus MC-1]|uniref:Protein-methionine-sulfoxide reductase catalytic subunit MsrP n=1 Tax=Magnetococcus marinus (strain ATCC BAA-1437 / JCM 17883 / MC-1) TaxID=156889 RepID=A0LAJ2_MAGMM|nr:protein-methionine-sulfoxide reductase catalytic subunit MsrP [Magnetococcus marinus]ABK44985.1 oxidoreductase, molybdopterin binding protein [Magnetococcus marinus MC-1]